MVAKLKHQDSETESWIRGISHQVRKALRPRFFGSIVIEIQQGKITRIKIERSIKDPKSLAPPDGEP